MTDAQARVHIPITAASECNFLAKVGKQQDPKQCLLWMAHRDRRGYGMLKIPGTNYKVRAHRYMYARVFTQVPADKMVCHSCDTPSCVNPFHLFLGDANDNVQDMIRKGRKRSARGERVFKAKLTAEKVEQIRTGFAQGTMKSELALIFGVHASTILRVVERRTWPHVR